MAAACVQAAAIDIQLGEGVRAQLHGAVTWGTQIRTESASPDAYADWPSRVVPGTVKGNLQGLEWVQKELRQPGSGGPKPQEPTPAAKVLPKSTVPSPVSGPKTSK